MYKILHISTDHILNKSDIDRFMATCVEADRPELAATFYAYLEQMKQQFIFEDAELNPNEDWIFLSKEAAKLNIEMWIKFWGGPVEDCIEFEILDVTPKPKLIV